MINGEKTGIVTDRPRPAGGKKMIVVDARIKWQKDCGNFPKLILLVDRVPGVDEMRYEIYGEKMYFAEKDGYCQFGTYDFKKGGNQGGYAGAKWEITLVDGSKKTVWGSWSSRSSVFNSLGFPHSMGASFTTSRRLFRSNGIVMESPSAFHQSGGNASMCAAAITIDLLKEVFERFPSLNVAVMREQVKMERFFGSLEEIVYSIVTRDGRKKPSAIVNEDTASKIVFRSPGACQPVTSNHV